MEYKPVFATYDLWSKSYDSDPNPLIPIEEMAVRSLLRTIKCDDVLDAATGTGRYALFLAHQGKHVTAVDASPAMLSQAEEKARQEKLAITFRQEYLSELSFDDASFDLVICALALSHNKDLVKPCQELIRVLRSNGNLIISDLHPFYQAHFGVEHKIEVNGKPYAFPLYHTQVNDYIKAVEISGAEVIAALDVPSLRLSPEEEYGADPGALLLWARKP